MLPDFLILGAMKAGTTSLYRYLAQHPGFARGKRKEEVHYFDKHWAKGIAWYERFFPSRWDRARASLTGRRLFTGESSPYYLFHPCVPARVKACLPRAKLIVLLREPVARAWSHYHHSFRKGDETLGFEEALAREPERLRGEEERLLRDDSYYSKAHRHFSYLARGIYADQLERWLQSFERERLLVLKSEDFFAQPRDAVAKVTDFLDLAPRDPASYVREFAIHNPGEYAHLDAATEARLRAYFAPHNERLAALLGPEFAWKT
jgi:hypothetical protein